MIQSETIQTTKKQTYIADKKKDTFIKKTIVRLLFQINRLFFYSLPK